MNLTRKHALRAVAVVAVLALNLNQLAFAIDLPDEFAAAQAAAAVPPPPSQIAAAHTVFLTNSGENPNFPIDSAQSFNAIYADLQAWGRFKMVSSPAQADLIFQLHGAAPRTTVEDDQDGYYSTSSPAFQLTILDPKTNTALWTITSPVVVAGRKQTYARWVALSESNLISRIKVLTGEPLSATETADLTTVPKFHTGRFALILVGGFVAAGVAGGLILHHEFENGLANQKASQDAFCAANNIPPSECAGG